VTVLELEKIEGLSESVSRAIARMVACGFFEHGIVGGSWCFPFYDAAVGIKYALRTLDLDFMVTDALHRRQDLIRDLEAELEDEGFISTTDYSTHLQKFHKPDLEVEFLTPRKGNRDGTVTIRSFNITAQPMPFLDILFFEPLTLSVKSLGGIVRVPSPRSMLIHKMIVAQRRKKESKKEKDLDQCKVIWLYCNNQDVQDLADQFKFSKDTWKSIVISCGIIGINPPLVPRSP
jgi:hypothetical protein